MLVCSLRLGTWSDRIYHITTLITELRDILSLLLLFLVFLLSVCVPLLPFFCPASDCYFFPLFHVFSSVTSHSSAFFCRLSPFFVPVCSLSLSFSVHFEDYRWLFVLFVLGLTGLGLTGSIMLVTCVLRKYNPRRDQSVGESLSLLGSSHSSASVNSLLGSRSTSSSYHSFRDSTPNLNSNNNSNSNSVNHISSSIPEARQSTTFLRLRD